MAESDRSEQEMPDAQDVRRDEPLNAETSADAAEDIMDVAAADTPRRSTRRRRLVSVLVSIVVNTVLGLPFLLTGIVGLTDPSLSELALLFLIVTVVGSLVVFIGLYVSVLSRPRLNLLPEEEMETFRHPSMKPAFVKIVMSIPFFIGAAYLVEFTYFPYVYPFAAFLVGIYLYFRGVIRYWINHHTVYCVTTRRVARIYRFLWLDTTEIPLNTINAISESRNFIEMITGRGSVLVASGIGSHHKVRMQEIDNPGPVAQTIRQLMSPRSESPV